MTAWFDRYVAARRSRLATKRRRREVFDLAPERVDEAAFAHWSSHGLSPVIDEDALEWIDSSLIQFPDSGAMFGAAVRLANPTADETFDDLSRTVKQAVAAALMTATTTPDNAKLCVWEGYGYPWNGNPSSLALVAPGGADPGPWPLPALPAAIRRGRKATMNNDSRGFVVFDGPVRCIERIEWRVTDDWFETKWPDISYPLDRAWLSYRDIDEDTVDVHGSRELVAQIRGIDGLTVVAGPE